MLTGVVLATTCGVGEVAPLLCVHATASLPSNFGRMIKSTTVLCRAAKCFRACTSQPGKPSREQALEARIAEIEAKLAKKDEVIAKKDAVTAEIFGEYVNLKKTAGGI